MRTHGQERSVCALGRTLPCPQARSCVRPALIGLLLLLPLGAAAEEPISLGVLLDGVPLQGGSWILTATLRAHGRAKAGAPFEKKIVREINRPFFSIDPRLYSFDAGCIRKTPHPPSSNHWTGSRLAS
ncbi:MAG: hypothetical protein EPO39_07700 [Candidatus Manganitrophaceae bacterium]|nr:MAG: hypothetical protein EPO39_07700 [Candidatus Manganitrophaceae bacterium]